MNDRPEPATNSRKSLVANQPRSLRVAALLVAAAPVAVALVALASPMAAPIRIGSAPADTTLVQPTCDVAIPSGALNPVKWPECGGD
ncbi:hypothetical protein FKR81_12885 [Lentzea tibetensis]|uniref:Uncharacterized protein n=1 Tax=Lentzea tibetensis TaxID=2591470 RepID=A0A563EVN0_9PSEU|nr:hypothetical protein [Lentzea tibetensis]TWP51755.1 hypothetical protein FKR81_12885 [Lentzea tibetensis]